MTVPGEFRPSRKLGQNFLIDTAAIERIVQAAELRRHEMVLEIGPGTGALTRVLLAHEAEPRITAVELDKRLVELLERQWGGESRMRLVSGDILRQHPENLLGDTRGLVITNAPYSISGALMRWLMTAAPLFDRAIVMFQKEVVDRIFADVGNKSYALLTIATRFHFRVERLFAVHAGAFRPRPRVDSTVVRFSPHPSPPVEVSSPELFMTVARAAFCQRRKTLKNCLVAGAATLPGGVEGVHAALLESGIDPGLRAERLDLEAFARLTNAFG